MFAGVEQLAASPDCNVSASHLPAATFNLRTSSGVHLATQVSSAHRRVSRNLTCGVVSIASGVSTLTS